MESRLTLVLKGIALHRRVNQKKKALSFRAVELAWRFRCQRDVEPDVDLLVPEIKEGIVNLPFKE